MAIVNLATTGRSPGESGADPAVRSIFDDLRTMHGGVHWHWRADSDPFEVALGAILVQNTSWSNAERALDCLRAAGLLSAGALAAQDDGTIEQLLRPSGQFRQKARKVRAFLDLVESEGGMDALLALPGAALREKLLATWGIGPETADCIVLYAAHQPAFVVDEYTARIFGRLGHGPPENATYDAWQGFFTGALPVDVALWADYHALVVIHGRDLCRKRVPRCTACTLRSRCRFASVAGDAYLHPGPLPRSAHRGHS